MGDRDELGLDGTDLVDLTVLDRDERRLTHYARFLEALASKPEAQRGSVDRRRNIAQEVREPTHVVLVPMGEHDPVDPLRVLPEIAEVREHQIDAGHVGVREHEAAVDDDDAPFDLDAKAVATDLPQSAQEDDADGSGHCAPT